eukprot:52646-Alexandrium_andersonii.AAC.1
MSASLVGSEMCIRDRFNLGMKRLASAIDLDADDGHCKTESDSSGSSPLTVSYTHLTLPTICSV